MRNGIVFHETEWYRPPRVRYQFVDGLSREYFQEWVIGPPWSNDIDAHRQLQADKLDDALLRDEAEQAVEAIRQSIAIEDISLEICSNTDYNDQNADNLGKQNTKTVVWWAMRAGVYDDRDRMQVTEVLLAVRGVITHMVLNYTDAQNAQFLDITEAQWTRFKDRCNKVWTHSDDLQDAANTGEDWTQ